MGPGFKILIKPDITPDSTLWWVAQCLEYDLVGQGENPTAALMDLFQTIAARKAMAAELSMDPFEGLPQAPAADWDTYENNAEPFDFTLPSTEATQEMLPAWMIKSTWQPVTSHTHR